MPVNSYPYSVGKVVGTIHALIVGLIVLKFDVNERIWIWMIFFVIDFPVSFLTTAGFDIMRNSWGPNFQDTWKSEVFNYWPVFVHGVIGSIWWYYLSVWFAKFLSEPSDPNKKQQKTDGE